LSTKKTTKPAASAAKKATPAKKTAAKKTAVKKSVAKKAATSPAKKIAKKAASPAPAKKAVAKKTATPAPAKKVAAKKSAPVIRDEGEELALAAAKIADSMKAEDIVILDVQKVSTVTDYFVICSGSSQPHLKAIAREVSAQLREQYDLRAKSKDGNTDSQWTVIDYGIVMVHIFHPEKRELYALEDLWGDARSVPVSFA
jgi:ribosome-associated protein